MSLNKSIISLCFLAIFGFGCNDNSNHQSSDGDSDSDTDSDGDADSDMDSDADSDSDKECSDGPLAAPIPNCAPSPAPSTGDYYEDCVARINQFRWECQCLPPLTRWKEAEDCVDQDAEYDSINGAHAGFQADICAPQGWAQNECPGWPSKSNIISGCLQQMWDEGPGEPFSEHGHYINMSSTQYTKVACGFYTTPGGDIWSAQNFE